MASLVIALTGISASAPGGPPSGDPGAQRLTAPRVTGAVLHLRHRIVDRRGATWRHQDAVEHPRTRTVYAERRTHSVPYLGWIRGLWSERAYKAWKLRVKLERLTLHDFAFAPGNDAWRKAVREVQRVFPGTESWLLSCSAAEGGWGRWVGYGGQGYSVWLRDSDTVGGPLQFRWSTFKGMYRHALDYVRARGFRVPGHLQDPSNDVAWRSALGQALAGGWARYTGNDDAHWSASWGNGC